LLAQNRVAVGELPKNYAKFRAMAWKDCTDFMVNVIISQENYNTATVDGTNMGGTTFTLTGKGEAIPNTPPVMAVYLWQRTA
jgi:hypothetical protein